MKSCITLYNFTTNKWGVQKGSVMIPSHRQEHHGKKLKCSSKLLQLISGRARIQTHCLLTQGSYHSLKQHLTLTLRKAIINLAKTMGS